MKTKILRISKSSLSVILAIMMMLSTMLVGTLTANAADTTYYVRGNQAEIGSWGPGSAMTPSADGTYSYWKATGNGDYQFKITEAADAWEPQYDTGNIDSSSEISIANQSGNCRIAQTGTFYIIFTHSTKKISASTSLPSIGGLATPTISSSSSTITPGGTVDITVTNAGAYPSGTTFVLYKDGVEVSGATFTNGKTTVDSTGSYKVMAKSGDTSSSFSVTIVISAPEAPSAKYALEGDLASDGQWNATMGSNDKIDTYAPEVGENVFKKEVTVAANKYFRLSDGSNQYRPVGTGHGNDFDVAGCSSLATAKLTEVGSDGAFKFSEAGSYIIYVDQSGSTPKVWVTGSAQPFKITVADCSHGNVTVTDESGTPISDLTQVMSGSKFKVSTEADTGYQLGSLTVKSGATTLSAVGGVYTMPSSDVTLTASFALEAPEVSLSAADSAYIGDTVDLTPVKPTEISGLNYTYEYIVKKNGTAVTNLSDYIEGDTFKTPCKAVSKDSYTVVLKVTVSDGTNSESATSAPVTITVNPSDYQSAYDTIVKNIAGDYPQPASLEATKTKATYEAYKTAYEAASNAVNGKPYPASSKAESDSDYETLSSNLTDAYNALADKVAIAKPVLAADTSYVTEDSSVTLSISNYSSYPNGVVFDFYKNDGAAPFASVTKADLVSGEVVVNGADLNASNTFAVKIKEFDNDNYICENADSNIVTVEKRTAVTVTVTPGANGSAYISKYTKIDGTVVNNTDTSLRSVSILSGSGVEFTAVPDANYTVASWNNNTSQKGQTYSILSVSADREVSVQFEETQEVYFYVAFGSQWTDSIHPLVTADGAHNVTQIQELPQADLYNGLTKIDAQSNKFRVFIYKADAGASVTVGRAGTPWGQTVTPVSGACYYYGTLKKAESNYGDGTGVIPALKLTEVNASSVLVKENPVNLTVTKNDHRGKTAGQDDYTVYYKVTKDGTVVHSGTVASFTPAESGDYVIEAYAVDNTSKRMYSNTVTKTITVYDELPSFKVDFGVGNKFKGMGTVKAKVNGTAINSGESVLSGTEVTFEATVANSKYEFIGWYDNPEGTGAALYTDWQKTITVSAAVKMYAVFGGKASDYRLVKNDNGTYTSLGAFRVTNVDNEFTLSLYLEENETFNFYIEKSALNTTPSPTANTDYFANETLGNKIAMYTYGDNFKYPTFTANEAGTHVFKWAPESGTNKGMIYVERPKTSGEKVKIYAKSGTIPMDVAGDRIAANMADVTVDSGYIEGSLKDATELGDKGYLCKTFNALKGSTINLHVKLKDDVVQDANGNYIECTKKYFVKAFCINGMSYGIRDNGPTQEEMNADDFDPVYNLTYKVPDDFEGDRIEITPIYFRTDDSNCVDIYVLGFDETVQSAWGNTIACYTWYDGEDLAGMGSYPGRPLVYEGGRYYIQVPKTIIDDNGVARSIQGMLLNNYAKDMIHKDSINSNGDVLVNRQTYDFDSFKRLAEMDGVDRVGFSFRRNVDYTNKASDVPYKDVNSVELRDDMNGFEELRNYYDDAVDIFGNPLTEEGKSKDPIAVVSVGDANSESKNYIGQFSTDWHVYAYNGTKWEKIGFMPPSAFLFDTYEEFNDVLTEASNIGKADRMEEYQNTYKAIADIDTRDIYADRPVYVTFDMARSYDDGNTFRSDGRWLNTVRDHSITADIEIEYADTTAGPFTKDDFVTDTNKGTFTNAHAHFSNPEADGKTTFTVDNDPSKYFTFEADKITTASDADSTEYLFVGWYLKSTDQSGHSEYTKLAESRAPMAANDTYVARYIKATKDDIRVYHELDLRDANFQGSANCYAKVGVYDGHPREGGRFITDYDTTADVITVPKNWIVEGSNYYLKITLTVETNGEDEFVDCKYYYDSEEGKSVIGSSDTEVIGDDKKTARFVRIIKVDESFFDHEEHKIINNDLYYYTTVKAVATPYSLTYNYISRTQGAKKYVVKGNLNGAEYDKYVTVDVDGNVVLSNDFIVAKAPYEDNFFNTIKWDLNNITTENNADGTISVNINSVTTDRTAKVIAFDINEGIFLDPVTVNYGKLVTYENLVGYNGSEEEGYLYTAPSTYIDINDENKVKEFSYWGIYTDSECKNLVAKCYNQTFNYVVYDNYYIKPVYEGKITGITDKSSTISFLDYSRNQWTDEDGNKTASDDKVYADFALSYEHGNDILMNGSANVKCGMFLEVCGQLEKDSDGNYITDLEMYKDNANYDTNEVDLAAIKTAIKEQRNDSKNTTLTYVDSKGNTRKLLNKNISPADLDNKNRIEYYIGYNNSENNQKQLMKAYSYIMYDADGDGTIDTVELCDTPVVFVNYYEVGNRIYSITA